MIEVPFAIRMAAAQQFELYRPAAAKLMYTAPLPDPDQIIGTNYMFRWWLAKIEAQHEAERLGPLPKRTTKVTDHNCYLHFTVGSDPQDMHDHPWPNASLVLEGSYIEHTPLGSYVRKAGDMVFRQPEDLHKLEVCEPVWSLFLTGPKVREWGFVENGVWIHWKEYTAKHPARAEKLPRTERLPDGRYKMPTGEIEGCPAQTGGYYDSQS